MTRTQARASGESKYNGAACKVCNSTLRYTTGGACVMCARANARARQAANPERQSRYHEQWRNNNREYLRVYYRLQRLRAKEQQPC